MNWFLALLAVSSLALVLVTLSATARDTAARGRTLVKEFCGSCHATGRSDRSPRAAAPPLRQIGRSYDLDGFAERLQLGISSGHPDMPEFIFDRVDARAVQAYLRSIQR